MQRNASAESPARPELVEGLSTGSAPASTGPARTVGGGGGGGGPGNAQRFLQRHSITLDHPTDWPGFRRAARALWQAGVLPEHVDWFTAGDAADDLFACNASERPSTPQPPRWAILPATHPAPQVPRDFVRLCESLILHRDPARFALMYRLLWRMTEQPDLRHDPLDADRLRAHHMARAVARDKHKMHAFVRFRPVAQPDGQTVHMAWFEPDHFITEANAGFFIRRFTQMHWAILTPDACVRWDGTHLHTSPGAQRSDAPPPDAGEALWLTYYRHIFNPARLKLNMMKKEMPTRYWHNLPEAALISELTHTAHERAARMVEAEATVPRRRIAPAVAGAAKRGL